MLHLHLESSSLVSTNSDVAHIEEGMDAWSRTGLLEP